jgi:hypothetical protein
MEEGRWKFSPIIEINKVKKLGGFMNPKSGTPGRDQRI